MTTNPYAPPVISAEPTLAKRQWFNSGARLLFWGFLAPILAFVSRGLLILSTLPSNGVGRVVKVVKRGAPPPPRVWDLDCFAAAGVELIGGLGGAAVLMGVFMLSREPLNMAKKLSLWVRGGTILVGGAWALLGFSKCICWFLQDDTSYGALLMLEISGRWVSILASLWLIRSIAVLRRNPYIRHWATASILVSLVAQGIGAIANAASAGQFFVLLFAVPQILLSFGTIWSARRLETPWATVPRRTPLVSADKPA